MPVEVRGALHVLERPSPVQVVVHQVADAVKDQSRVVLIVRLPIFVLERLAERAVLRGTARRVNRQLLF